jgi:DNA modification methylase
MKATAQTTIEVPEALVSAVLSQERVDEPPHSFYKYPARFSPAFAREAINAFTKRGDTVIDPFCGGGTSLVEAISLGRRAVGFDISSLAVFLARAKTTPLSVHDKRGILEWARVIQYIGLSRGRSNVEPINDEGYYQRNLPDAAKNFFETILICAGLLSTDRQRNFVRLVLVGVGQWALDCKKDTPTWEEMRIQFCEQIEVVVKGHYEYLSKAATANELPRCHLTQMRRVINRSSEESNEDGRVPAHWLPAKLVVTSPPYPGVHVVYHRWQIQGRKETPAPFWLANSRDGAGEAHYCLGRRSEPELKTYFDRLGKAFSSVRGLLGNKSVVAQLVAFSDPGWQLPEFLKKMSEAGFTELRPLCDEIHLTSGRIWRHVPGRKWYANQKGKLSASKEVLLLHRPLPPDAD